MRKIIVVLQLIMVSVFAFSCKSNSKKEILKNQNDTNISHKHEWLKQYAFCDCIKYSFKDDSIKNDLSTGVLANISDYGSDSVYSRIDSFSKLTSLKIQPSQIADHNGKKAVLLDCINYYQSKKLDSLVRSFDHLILKEK